jgi:hypothetical protein
VRLADHAGNEFQLVILSYQHPDVHEDRWDSNWLLVSGTVATAAGHKWTFSAPCVTTFELAELADWFDELSADGRAPGQFDFTEPHVRFAYVPWPKRTLQLTLTGEVAPPAVAAHEKEAGVTLEFPLSEGDAKEFAGEIRDALADFPVRGGAA